MKYDIITQARVEQELLETVQSLQKLSDTMRASDKCAIEPSYLDNFKELTEVSGQSVLYTQ